MLHCLYCASFDHDGATCAKRLKALADHEADWNAFAVERQAFYEAQPVKERRIRTQSTTARWKFTPEARAEYFTLLADARQTVDAITSKGTVLQTASEPAWMRSLGMDERIHNRERTEL